MRGWFDKPMVPVNVLNVKDSMEKVFQLEGAKRYLVKPIGPIQLTKKIEGCIGSDD